jgi:hypothetical protein
MPSCRNTEYQAGDEFDEFHFQSRRDLWLGTGRPGMRIGKQPFGRGGDLRLRPSRQSTADEDASAFGMLDSSIGPNHSLAQCFVCLGDTGGHGESQVGLRSFFLPAIARSRLRR